ncbi:hypothetical protein B566_EDAN003875 [Ephemera danica]|nr:hypothetical protein B566_EDAN003875 [Ephemera danica]
MVYVSSGGTIGRRSPWNPSTWIEWFWTFINAIVLFFRSLVNPGLNRAGSQYTTDYRPPGGGPPKPPQRRMGGFGTISSLPCPPGGGG